MAPDLVVMAAGIGSRYGGLKQLEPMGPAGELLLDYAVYDSLRVGVQRVVFVVRRELERDFHAAVGRRFEGRLELVYAFQELDDLPPPHQPPPTRRKPWGTGHAVLAARRHVRGPVIVINADDMYGPEGIATLAAFLGSGNGGQHAMVAYRLGQTLSPHGPVSRGVCVVRADDTLGRIEECTGVRAVGTAIAGLGADGTPRRFSGREPVSMNLWGFQADIFPILAAGFERFLAGAESNPDAEFYLPHAVTDAIAAGRATVRVFTTDFPWLGVTAREDRDAVVARLRELVHRGVYPSPLWPGP